MKKKSNNVPYERAVKCELCGAEFTITNKYCRAKRCPACTEKIRNGSDIEEKGRKKKIHVSKLDTLASEAKAYGMSYGKYVSLKAQGYQFRKPTPQAGCENHAWQDWRDKMYATVMACKERAEDRGA